MATTEKRPVIEVTGLKKQYKLGQIGGGTLTHDLQSWWARVRGKEDPNTVIGTDQRLFGQTFMALNGVDLTVYQGEALGIIGRNGAGKSTLLKLLSRITAPTEGEIKIRGRVASMLGSVLNLKPIISCDADGAYYVVSKARGRVKSIAETVALALKQVQGNAKYCIAVANGSAREEAAKLAQELRQRLPDAQLFLECEVSPALGVHTGPGLLGIGVQVVEG